MNEQHDILVAVAKIGELVTTTLDTEELLHQVVAITARIMKVDVCSIYLYDTATDDLVLAATKGLKNDAVRQVRIPSGEGITGRAAKQGRIVAVSNVLEDKRNKYYPITGEENYRSLLCAPLKFRDELIGVINLQTTRERTYSPHERRLIKTIADLVSGSIRNARLYENVLAAKRELEDTQARLVQSEKMAALGRLAATLSHELRNPLAGLKGASQLLMKRTDARDERSQYITLILDEVERLGRIVDDLLHFARPREIRHELLDANKIVEDILLLNAHDLDHRGINVHKRLSKLPPVRADKDKMKQVMFNIILNAMDAMPEGGDLFITSGLMRDETDAMDVVSFQIRDTGPGMDDDIIPNVFEPFFTTKPTGVGLGLAVCRTIIEEHGGTVWVTSAMSGDQRGTIVTVEMPLNEQKQLPR